jgi:hypothetical protein
MVKIPQGKQKAGGFFVIETVPTAERQLQLTRSSTDEKKANHSQRNADFKSAHRVLHANPEVLKIQPLLAEAKADILKNNTIVQTLFVNGNNVEHAQVELSGFVPSAQMFVNSSDVGEVERHYRVSGPSLQKLRCRHRQRR